jgi:hypothetical protein
MWSRSVRVPQMLAEEYFSQGRTEELLARVERFRLENLQRAEKTRPDAPFDGHSDATRLIVDYLEVLKLAAADDQAGIWKRVQDSNLSAQQALLPGTIREATIGLTVEKLTADRLGAVDFLKGRFRRGDPAERAWAAVLLARLGEVKNVEALHRLAAAVESGKQREEQERAELIRTDYLFAVVLAEPTAREGLYQRYRNTELVSAAQNAMFRERRPGSLLGPTDWAAR